MCSRIVFYESGDSTEGKRYADLDSPNGDRHYVLVEWGTKPKKSLCETEAKRISKSDASNLLFMVRE